ncbi:hypothetical protein D3C85_1274220 [compost metagenome]
MKDGAVSTLQAAGSTYDGTEMDLVDSAAKLTFQETIKLIELLNVSGIFVEINPA